MGTIKSEVKPRLKLIFNVSVLVFVFTIACSFIVYHVHKQNTLREHIEDSKNMNMQITRLLSLWIDNNYTLTHLISESQYVIETCANPTNEYLRTSAKKYLKHILKDSVCLENIVLVTLMDKAENIYITDGNVKKNITKGSILLDAVGRFETIEENLLDKDYIQSILSGKKCYTGESYFSRITNQNINPTSVPIMYKGKLIGAVVTAVQLSFFHDYYIRNVRRGETGYMSVIDERGRIMYHPNKAFILNDKFAKDNSEMISLITNNNEIIRASVYGIPKIIVSKRVNVSSEFVRDAWYVVSSQNVDEILDETRTFIIEFFIFMIFFSTLIFFAIFLFY